MHDVFISYQKNTKTIADNIVNTLEKNNIRCWYAPRDNEGEYARSIVNAIKQAKIFIIILNEAASNSNHVLNEVETAYKIMEDGPLKILPFKVSNEVLGDAMTYYIKRFHWIDASNITLDVAIEELLAKTRSLLGIQVSETGVPEVRMQNKYFQFKDKNEIARLTEQRKLTDKMSAKTYEKVKSEFSEPIILDVGSNDGCMSAELIKKLDAKLLLGLELDSDAVRYANEKYGSERAYFYAMDLEDLQIKDNIREVLALHNLEQVDILHISMVLLHLKSPFKVLKNLRGFLRPGGKIIIRDIDDGYNVAYPDEKGFFKKTMEMINRNPRWGYRKSGREIYTYLKKLNCQNITLEALGINTMNMTFNEREALYHTYFGGLGVDLDYLVEHVPENKTYRDDQLWYQNHNEEMETEFHQNSFYFLLGFVLFTANVD